VPPRPVLPGLALGALLLFVKPLAAGRGELADLAGQVRPPAPDVEPRLPVSFVAGPQPEFPGVGVGQLRLIELLFGHDQAHGQGQGGFDVVN